MSEHAEQVALVSWFRYQYPKLSGCLWAIPNGGKRHIRTAITLSNEGVTAGVSDLFLMVANKGYHGLFIEMKAKKGRLQPNQLAFLNLAIEQGYRGEVCFGFEHARDVISEYLK